MGEKYKLHGSFELVAQQGLNSVKGKQFGAPKVDFGNGKIVRFQVPSALLNVIFEIIKDLCFSSSRIF